MQLDDARIELRGEGRHPRDLVARHRHHHVLGPEPPVAGRNHEPVPVPRQPVDPDAGTNRQFEARGVGLEVVGHLVLGGERLGRGGEGHPRQPAEASGGEQAKRVPALAPGVADPLVRVEDHEADTTLRQVVPDREAGLAAADDNGLDTFRLTQVHPWHWPPGYESPTGSERYERSVVRAIGSSPHATSPCSIANSVAAARVDTPIFT